MSAQATALGVRSNAELLELRAQCDAGRVFLRFGDASWTFGAACDAVARLAGGLAARGVRPGDRVAVMLPNSPEFVFTSLALGWLGAVEVPLNTALKGEVLRHQITDSASSLAIVDAELLERFDRACPDGAAIVRVIVGDAEAAADRVPYADLAGAEPVARTPVGPSTLAAIMYTSGTTGRAKGVEVTHGHAGRFAADWISAVQFVRDDVLLTPLPLFHSIARTLGVLPTLLLGAQICVVPRFSGSRFWDDVRRYDPTVVHGIFGIVPILLNMAPQPGEKDHRVRSFYIGPSGLSAAFVERFGIEVIEVYGATETGVVTVFEPGSDVRPGSCGRANSATYDVELFDDDDRPVADGEIGEFVVRPREPWTMLTGYYGRPEETAEAFRNLWFHTGDYGRRDADGFFYFVDRKKDAIRRRGENITSGEVEQAVNAHPAVAENAVIAVPSELGEDEVMSCIVLHPGEQLDFAELTAFLDERLPYFMVPRYLEVLPELPKTANEKVQKVELRRRGDQGITATTWDRERHGVELTR
jgi:crotonobetaine/carnitine-CoA ligase